jgi:hypothetical protein
MTFGDYLALVRECLDRRQTLVEQIENRALKSGAQPVLPLELSRLHAQLAARHVADGFEPIPLEGTSHELDPLELAGRAHRQWDRHRWPGRSVRLRNAAMLYSVFLLRQLEHLSLLIWDEGHDAADDRLQEIQGLLDRVNDGTVADPLVRDARWLIQTAQGPLTRRLEPYFRIADRISASFTDARRLEIHKAAAMLTSGHLRSQLRHRALETDRSIDDPDVLAITRNSNSMDAALLVRDLVPLLEAYGTARGDDRLTLADAILQAVSADPELLVTRLDLLGPGTMIEHLFIEPAEGGPPRYTPMGDAHRQRLDSYAGLIGRHAESLREDARSLDPRHAVYSPLGLVYGFCADILSNMALDSLFARPSFGLTLEDMFTGGAKRDNTRARADGWPIDYSDAWAAQMFDRTTSALAARARHPDRANASDVADARLFLESAPDGTRPAQEHCLTSDLQLALATGATAFPRGQIVNDRNEGRFLASADVNGKWFGISKVILTLCTSQGQDALLTGVPPLVVDRLRLTCPGLVGDGVNHALESP